MARRPTTPARRKRRTAVCAVLLPLLLAALLLVLDVPFLTARGALAATQERYAFGPGEVIARFSPQQEGMPCLLYTSRSGAPICCASRTCPASSSPTRPRSWSLP